MGNSKIFIAFALFSKIAAAFVVSHSICKSLQPNLIDSSVKGYHSTSLFGSSDNEVEEEVGEASHDRQNNNDESSATFELTEEETNLITSLWNKSNEEEAKLRDILVEALPTMPPQLTVKLMQSSPQLLEIVGADQPLRRVAKVLKDVMDNNLSEAKEVLAKLLRAGEIRKLDNEIGKAFREGKLDMAFFTVLNMNLENARMQMEREETQDDIDDEEESAGASRISILQHVYTRCQEEVEKSVPAGMALLNKLMRTDQAAIRVNQLQHYLCPQPDVITLPDGQVIPVKDSEQNKVLVPPMELVEAVSSTVLKIRTMEKAGAMQPELAANMVESCRDVAKEARMIIGENYGIESDELREFEDGLQPVFRPSSPDSPYIQGSVPTIQ